VDVTNPSSMSLNPVKYNFGANWADDLQFGITMNGFSWGETVKAIGNAVMIGLDFVHPHELAKIRSAVGVNATMVTPPGAWRYSIEPYRYTPWDYRSGI